MELRRYLAILKRRWLLVALAVVAGVAAGYISTPKIANYTAETTIYVGSRQLASDDLYGVSNDVLTGLERISQTFAEMIRSEPTAVRTRLARTNLRRSAESVVGATSAAPKPRTQLLKVRVTDPEPAVAQQLANAVSDAFVEKIETFEPGGSPQPGEIPKLPAYVFERAKLPTTPEATGLINHMIVAGLFGFVLAAGLSLLLEYVDVTVKGPADAERRLELPVLAVIPFEREELVVKGAKVQARAS